MKKQIKLKNRNFLVAIIMKKAVKKHKDKRKVLTKKLLKLLEQ